MEQNLTGHTYGEYKTWTEGRWELIDGVVYDMCAAPNRAHQRLSGVLFLQIGTWLKGKTCRVYAAPFDVVLPDFPGQDEDEASTVVQPDLVVYCDRGKLTKAGATGAPDWVVEIVSPWTSKKDLNEKFRLYERVGVREYWVIDPAAKSLQIYVLGADKDNRIPGPAGPKTTPPLPANRYGSGRIHVGGGLAVGTVLEGFTVQLEELFEED
jgi:Uma2 family endonuclease